MVQTYIVGTILYGWVEELDAAIAGDNIVWILDNDHRIIAYWYSTSATYIFSIVPLPFWKKLIWEWFIKLGIAWFLCRLSNNILQYGRWKNSLFWYVVGSFVCVVIIFWATCPPNDFITETLSSVPPSNSQLNGSNVRLYEMSLESPIDYSWDVQRRCRYRFISVSLSNYFHGERPFVFTLLSPLYLL